MKIELETVAHKKCYSTLELKYFLLCHIRMDFLKNSCYSTRIKIENASKKIIYNTYLYRPL